MSSAIQNLIDYYDNLDPNEFFSQREVVEIAIEFREKEKKEQEEITIKPKPTT